jgi:uncharacterized repeat protein (TIGR01451 family)
MKPGCLPAAPSGLTAETRISAVRGSASVQENAPAGTVVGTFESGTDGTVVAGDTLRYSASITNDGDRDVTGVVFTVPLPEGTEYAGSGKRSDANIAYDSDLNQLEWTGDIPAGGTTEISFDVRVKSGGNIAFSDTEIAFDSDGDGVNDVSARRIMTQA